jgi:RHS repeat-associated protein
MQTPVPEWFTDFETPAGAEPPLPRFSHKNLDEETGFCYHGARYLNPKTSIWISADPAVSDYIPSAPVDDEAKKHNENLPGMGGVFNYVNMHVYHYAGNNPIKYIDPDGREDEYLPSRGLIEKFDRLIEDIAGTEFGKTREGQYIVESLRYLNAVKHIRIKDLNEGRDIVADGYIGGQFDPSKQILYIDKNLPEAHFAGVLTHEGSHASDRFKLIPALVDREVVAFQRQYAVNLELQPDIAYMPTKEHIYEQYKRLFNRE